MSVNNIASCASYAELQAKLAILQRLIKENNYFEGIVFETVVLANPDDPKSPVFWLRAYSPDVRASGSTLVHAWATWLVLMCTCIDAGWEAGFAAHAELMNEHDVDDDDDDDDEEN